MSDLIRLEFVPQVEQNDDVYEATIASNLQTTWSVSVDGFIDHFDAANLKEARAKFETEHELRDDLRLVDNAPQWIQEWEGPFEVRYEQLDHCDRNGNDNCLQGIECSLCSGVKQLTTDEFIARASEVHGGKYNVAASLSET